MSLSSAGNALKAQNHTNIMCMMKKNYAKHHDSLCERGELYQKNKAELPKCKNLNILNI